MHCTVIKVLNLLIKKINELSQSSVTFKAYRKGAPQTDCAVVRVFFLLERVDFPVMLGHPQCSGTSVGVPW